MGEDRKARGPRHAGLVIVVAAGAAALVARVLMDLLADWPTAVEWLVAVSLAVIVGGALGAWLRNPDTGAAD